MILGIDEVGRGAWAGPLVVGAVVLGTAEIVGLNDSKLLTTKKREILNDEILIKADGVGLGWVDAEELDKIGLSEALRVATRRAVEQIDSPYHEIIIDGTINFLDGTSKGQYVTTLKKADQLVPSVSAASIVAKVARDKYMQEQDKNYPGYGFRRNVGYGTKLHIDGINNVGISKIHRMSFKPIKSGIVSTKQVGNNAEDLVLTHLKNTGHKLLQKNWRTKFCEVDIITEYNNVIYFTEVKYRKNSDRGSGLEMITNKKLKQMKLAVNIYMSNKSNAECILAVASVSGIPMKIDDWLEII